jgi:hypothetical protein
MILAGILIGLFAVGIFALDQYIPKAVQPLIAALSAHP